MKKMNNRGFTIIELTLSFIFVFTLAFSMYQLLFNYRQKQNEESIKAQMIDYRDQVTLAIQNDINEKELRLIDYCVSGNRVVDRCLVLHFNDGSTKQLSVEKGTKTYDGEDYEIQHIVYGGIVYESSDAILLDYRANYMLYHTYDTDGLDDNMNLYRISIPIYHNDLDGNYGINIVAVGYDYEYHDTSSVVEGETVQKPDSSKQTKDGRVYDGYVTSTNRTIGTGFNNQTIVARVKFDSNHITGLQQFFGNWQLAGSGLSLKNKKACYGAYISVKDKAFSSTYKEICSDAVISDTNFHTIVGTFDSTNKTMNVYLDGTGKSLTLSANSSIDKSVLDFAIGGNIGNINNSNLFYGTISHAIVYNRTIPEATISSCLKTGVDTECVKNAGIENTNKLIDEELIVK